MAVTLWWVRHGPTHARGMVGWTDLDADLQDRARLARLSAFLPGEAPVISSDLARARQTAEAIAGARERLADDPALREMHFGQWEMRAHDELEAEDPERIRAFWERPGEVRPPGGESWDEVAHRVSAAADRLAARGGDIIVVAHFGAILSQLQRALDVAPAEVFAQRIDNLSVTALSLGDRWQAGVINHCP